MAEDKKTGEPQAEEPQAETPKAEEPQAEEPKAKEVKAEEPKAEEPKAEKPKAEEPKAEESKAKQPKAKTAKPKAADKKAEAPKAEQPKAEEVKTKEPKAEEPKAEEPEAERPKTLTDLKDLAGVAGTMAPAEAEVEAPREPRLDNKGRAYSTGKRKNAIARVWVKPGPGRITVNGRDQETYFARPVLRMIINQPFAAAAREGQYDVICTVTGGGLSGQAGAVRHGISRALTEFEPALRPVLKKGGFLTRDSRVVERKKFGRRKARRSFQFSKR